MDGKLDDFHTEIKLLEASASTATSKVIAVDMVSEWGSQYLVSDGVNLLPLGPWNVEPLDTLLEFPEK